MYIIQIKMYNLILMLKLMFIARNKRQNDIHE